MTDVDQLTTDELIIAHKVLSYLQDMFEEEANGTPEEAETLDDAMWYVEEQMPDHLQKIFGN